MARSLLVLGAPLVVFGFWGLVDFRSSANLAEPLRLAQELVLSGIAAVAAYTAGWRVLAWVLVGLSLGHQVLVYLMGESLLKR